MIIENLVARMGVIEQELIELRSRLDALQESPSATTRQSASATSQGSSKPAEAASAKTTPLTAKPAGK